MSADQAEADDVVIRELGPEEIPPYTGGVGETGLTVLPLRRTGDGRGVYAEDQVFLVKELRAEGLEVRFADESHNRLFEAKFGVVDEWIVPYLFGVATNGGWEGLQALVRRLAGRGDKDVRITAITAGPDGRGWMIEGPANKLPRAVVRLQKEAEERHDE